MYTSQGKRTSTDELKSYRTFFAVTSLIAMAIVFFGLQIMMVGPLKSQLEGIQSRLGKSEASMRKLVAERDELWRTNDLLSGLHAQAKQVQSIEATLTSIQALRQHVEHEAAETQKAITAFESIASLHKQLAAQEAHTAAALVELDELIALRQSIVESAKDTDAAIASLDDLNGVTAAAIASSSQVAEAEASITKLADLKYRMLGESDGIAEAAKTVDRIVAINEKLDSEQIGAAEENANRLLVINDSLAAVDTSAAGSSLDGLIDLESRLVARADVADAVQTLEVLDDFQAEIDAHIRSIEGIRRTMVEIAMLESSVGRAARVLEPLVELSNLRRLGEREVREAARVILDQRSSTRLSQKTSITDSHQGAVIDTNRLDDLVPYPPEAQEASVE